MPSLIELPKEILLYIFQLYMKTENQITFMRKITNVSSDWNNLCLDCSLWKTFDGTIPFTTMMMMCGKGSFKITKEFIISPTVTLSDQNVAELFPKLKNVNSLDFSNLTKITTNILPAVENNCPNLVELHFGKIENDKPKKQLNYKILGTFLTVRGSSLLTINLSFCCLRNASLVIRCIADCCPNLEQFYLISISFTSTAFPTKYFQQKCPKLKVLHLDHSLRITKDKCSEGFPNLENFSFYDPNGTALYDEDLLAILFNSTNLKVLNLNLCHALSADILNEIPATTLQCLNISRTKACTSVKLSSVLRKWCHSLTEVDVSYASNGAINDSIALLVLTPQQSPLKSLNLSYSSIKPDVIERVLEKSSQLQEIRLESCRSLGRGMKKVYIGKFELQELKKNIKSFISNRIQGDVIQID